MATSLREGHSRQSSHLSQGEREAHSHPASLLSERDGSLLLPHSRQSSILSALSDSFSSSYYSHSLSSHSRQTSLLSSHRSSPSSHSRVSSLLSDSTSPFPASSFYPSQAQSSPHGLPSYSASPSQPHRLQQNGNHCRQPSASSSHSRSSPPLHACVFHQFHLLYLFFQCQGELRQPWLQLLSTVATKTPGPPCIIRRPSWTWSCSPSGPSTWSWSCSPARSP